MKLENATHRIAIKEETFTDPRLAELDLEELQFFIWMVNSVPGASGGPFITRSNVTKLTSKATDLTLRSIAKQIKGLPGGPVKTLANKIVKKLTGIKLKD